MIFQRSETDTMQIVWFQKVVDALVHRLNSPDSSRCHVLCLKTLRMFSREKDKLVNMVSEITIATIMKMTGLNHYAVEEGDLIEIQNGDPEGKYERERKRKRVVFYWYDLQSLTDVHIKFSSRYLFTVFFFLPADVTINLHLLHFNRDSILHKIYLKQFLCVSYET